MTSEKPSYEELERRVRELEAAEFERHRVETDLPVSHRGLLSIFDGIDEPVYVSDPATYEMVFVNKVIRDLFGEVGERTCYEYLQHRDSPCPFCTNNRILDERSGPSVVWEHRNEATGRWYRCIDKAIQWPDGRLLRYEMAVDITDRKLAEEALREKEESLATTLNSIGDGVIATDKHGLVVHMNPPAEDLCGWSLADAAGKPLAEVFHIVNAHTREAAEDPVRRVLETGRIVGLANHTLLLSRDGTAYQIADSAAPIRNREGITTGVVLVFSDVTEKYEAAERLRLSEERYDLAMEVKNEGMWDWDLVTDETYFDDRYYTMAGYEPNEFPQDFQAWADHVHPDDLPGAREAIRAYLSGESDRFDTEFRFRCKDDAWIWIRGRGRIFEWDERGTPLRMIGTHSDITQRKQAETALQESEERFRLFAELAPVGIVISDQHEKTLYVSPKFVDMFGYTSADMTSVEEWWRLAYPQEERRNRVRLEWNAAIDEAKRTGPEIRPMEFPVACKDGTVRQIEFRMRTTGDVNVVVFSDITERKRAEETLRKSEQSFRILAENMPVMVNAITKDEIFTFWNKACEETTGFSAGEILSNPRAMSLMYPDSAYRRALAREWEEAGGKFVNKEAWLTAKDGGERCVLWTNLPPELTFTGSDSWAVGVDITDRKQAEQALRDSEQRYRTILKSIADGYYEVDLAGNLTFFNDSVCELLGYSRSELLGMNDRQYTDEQGAAVLFRTFNEVYRTGRSTKGLGWEVIRKDRTRRFVEASVTLMRDAEGKPSGFRGIVRDITERKRSEEEKEKLQAQLARAQKMESIGILAGGIAHNFNNILMGIQGRASLMMMDKGPSHADYEHLRGIEAYIKNAVELTKDLLGFARGGKYEVKPTDMNALIKHENRMFGRTKREVRVQGKYEKPLWTVEVDPNQMRQALLNLYVNAWQAMPGGGTLYVQTENITLDEESVKPFAIHPGRYVKISVTDTGVGMDEATLEKVFDPFFSTKDTGQGSGLGLASVYGIVKHHGGFINAYSEQGVGTTFTVYLPASEKEAVQESPAPELCDIHYGRGTVLLVDDEDMILEVGRQMLERLGYRVLVARSGEEGLEIYGRQREEIVLVILDMIMPGMGGGEVFDKLRAADRNVNVLLSSGYSINGQAKEIMDRGCGGFIQKPFAMEALSRKVKEALDP